MSSCLPSRYRFLDLLFALVGTVTFLLDLCSDVWGAVEYYRAGDLAWAGLLLAFYGFSSVALQLLSWGWFWVDRGLFIKPRNTVIDPHPRQKEIPVSPARGENGTLSAEGTAFRYGLLPKNGHVKEVLEESGSTRLAGRERGNGHIEHGQEDLSPGLPTPVELRFGGAVAANPADKTSSQDCNYSLEPARRHAVPAQGGYDYPDTVPWKADAEQAPGDAGTALFGHGVTLQAWAPNSNTSPTADYSALSCPGSTSQMAKEIDHQLSYSEDCFLRRFNTSLPLFCPSLLAILHFFQLGYPYRCIHSLEVGITAYRNKDHDSLSRHYQEYAYLLTHDISMMRLIETFMENTPQLILLLYILLQRSVIHTFQYFSICITFISISWAILDYHQSLRFFLRDKQKLNVYSSLVYFLWNFLVIFSRIACITLFTSVFHCWIALHFFLLWVSFFVWAWLQDTTFMENRTFEHFYRAIVAVILYFSWFNIADGRTLYRCIIYYVFLMTDSMILLFSWNYLRIPSVLDEYEKYVILVLGGTFFVGLLLRLLYYRSMHPNVGHQPEKFRDEPDGITNPGVRNESQSTQSWPLATASQRILHAW